MSKLVAAFGSSHSVMLTCTLQDWQTGFPERDAAIQYYDAKGTPCSYADLLAQSPSHAGDLMKPAAVKHRFREVHDAMARLKRDIETARLDVLIVCGDDQNELFAPTHMPSIGIYYGDTILNAGRPEPLPTDWYRRAQSMRQEPSGARQYPCHSALACALIEGLIARGFDPSAMSNLASGQSEGHAFSFVHRFYLSDLTIPIVPVFLNTFYPPNQPAPARCVALGQAVRDIVDSYGGDLRIGLMASGGLSHFHVEEQLDQAVIEALRSKDKASLASIDPRLIQSGSSEIRNWMMLAGAIGALELKWLSYTPGFRTNALTGTGLTFASWL